MWGRNDSRLTFTAAGNISDVGKVGWAAGKPTEYLANKRSRSHRSSILVLSYLRQWKPKCSVNFIVQEVFRQAPHFAYISASPWKSRDFSKCMKGNDLYGKNVKTGSKRKQSRWSRHCCRGPMAAKHPILPLRRQAHWSAWKSFMRKPVHSAENNANSHLQFKLGWIVHSSFICSRSRSFRGLGTWQSKSKLCWFQKVVLVPEMHVLLLIMSCRLQLLLVLNSAACFTNSFWPNMSRTALSWARVWWVCSNFPPYGIRPSEIHCSKLGGAFDRKVVEACHVFSSVPSC